MTIEPSIYDSTGIVEIGQFDRFMHDQGIGRFEGQIDQSSAVHVASIMRPMSLAQVFQPQFLGRAHIEMGMDIRLASPRVFGATGCIVCDGSEIRLETTSGVFSRWLHWYANWEPVIFPELESSVCSLVTVSKSNIDDLRHLVGTRLGRWARVRQTVRSSRYGKYKVKSEVFCSLVLCVLWQRVNRRGIPPCDQEPDRPPWHSVRSNRPVPGMRFRHSYMFAGRLLVVNGLNPRSSRLRCGGLDRRSEHSVYRAAVL